MQPPTSWSAPAARTCRTAAALSMCTKPMLEGRWRPASAPSLDCRTKDCTISTLHTSPYWRKCCFKVRAALKPSLLMRRTTNKHSGSSSDNDCKLPASVWGMRLSGTCRPPSTGAPLTTARSAPFAACLLRGATLGREIRRLRKLWSKSCCWPRISAIKSSAAKLVLDVLPRVFKAFMRLMFSAAVSKIFKAACNPWVSRLGIAAATALAQSPWVKCPASKPAAAALDANMTSGHTSSSPGGGRTTCIAKSAAAEQCTIAIASVVPVDAIRCAGRPHPGS
mmetsp:Transcript_112923/g.326207  ORF Transcript_112923/g.326207 Transcript_112923/m.326207 type:complete len:280 (+) Transcript_112923:292-1131(+)